MIQNTRKLNNCPLCGSEHVGTYCFDGKYCVSCEDCNIRTQSYDSENEAHNAWNRLPEKVQNQGKIPFYFRKIHPSAEEPVQHEGVGYDLVLPEGVVFDGIEHKMVSLGLAIKLPEGYYAHLLLRSSSPKRYGILLANSLGIVDPKYCGNNDEWKLSLLHWRDRREGIPAGTTIAQFIIVPIPPKIYGVETTDLGEPDRGGFGSTGL